MTHNLGAWFEIAVTDMDRAVTFYEAVLGVQLQRHMMGGLEMAWFPADPEKPGASGSLCKHAEQYRPSTDGTILYFASPAGDLSVELARVEAAGGKVLQPKKTEIGQGYGFMGVFLDSEGNRVAFHSLA